MLDIASTSAHYSLIVCKITDHDNVNVSRLPLSVRQQAERFSGLRHVQFLTGRALLAELLFHRLAIEQLPEIVLTEKGRPVFCDPVLPDFNISHSGDHIMVGLAAPGYGIGLDIELNRPRSRLLALAGHSFSDSEYQWLSGLAPQAQAAGFWQLWTLRESVLKLTGKGVWQMKAITVLPERNTIKTPFLDSLFTLTSQLGAMYWAISSCQPFEENSLALYQADSGLSEVKSLTLPVFTAFSSTGA